MTCGEHLPSSEEPVKVACRQFTLLLSPVLSLCCFMGVSIRYGTRRWYKPAQEPKGSAIRHWFWPGQITKTGPPQSSLVQKDWSGWCIDFFTVYSPLFMLAYAMRTACRGLWVTLSCSCLAFRLGGGWHVRDQRRVATSTMFLMEPRCTFWLGTHIADAGATGSAVSGSSSQPAQSLWPAGWLRIRPIGKHYSPPHYYLRGGGGWQWPGNVLQPCKGTPAMRSCVARPTGPDKDVQAVVDCALPREGIPHQRWRQHG
jgi:hypothetical protein